MNQNLHRGILSVGLAVLCCLASTQSVMAGAVKRVNLNTVVNVESSRTDQQTVNQTINQVANVVQNQTYNNFSTETHRIVTGAVAKGLQDHSFLSKPFDADQSFDVNGNLIHSDFGGRGDGGALLRSNVLTASDEAFLATVNKSNANGDGDFFTPNTQFFFDLTNQTFPAQAASFGKFGNDEAGAIAQEESNFFSDPRFAPSSTTSSVTTSATTSSTSSSLSTTQNVTHGDQVNVTQKVTQTNFGVFNFATATATTIDTTHVTTVTTVNTTTNLTTNTTTNTTVNNTNTVNYQLVAAVYNTSPIVLDLKGDREIDVAYHYWLPHAPKFYTHNALFFDINGTGTDDFCEWFIKEPKDGLLCKPEDGKVTSALQLFGTAGGFKDGYEKLRLLDKDHSGYLEGAELDGLMIWIDGNHDGKCQPEELHPLSDYHIKRISVSHTNYVSKYETEDGKSHVMWDWWPAESETRKFRTAASI